MMYRSLALILGSPARPAAGLLAAAAVLFAGGAAQAEQPELEFTLQGSASLSDLRFELVDLAPADGIAAQYRIDPGAFTSVSTHLRMDERYEQSRDPGRQPGWLVPGNAVLSYPGPGGSGASQAALERRGLSVSGVLESSEAGEFSARSQSFSKALTPADPLLAGLALAPHSQLTVSADYALSAFVDGPPCSFENACALLDVGASFQWAGALRDSGMQGKSLLLRNDAPLPVSRQDSGRLAFTLTNDTSRWMSEYLVIEAHVTGIVLPPVPEPASWALAAAGLAALAFVSRRAG